MKAERAFEKKRRLRGLKGGKFDHLRGDERRAAQEAAANRERVATGNGGLSKLLRRFLREDKDRAP